jgi:HD-like signal output (HDOD) protein
MPLTAPVEKSKEMESRLDPQVAHRLRDLSLLVSLPQITLNLINLISDAGTTNKQLQAVVELDPALTAKVISLANSAFYSVRTPVLTVDRAITIIGYQELGLMALGLGLSETFDLSTVPMGFDGESLWIHSLAVSWLSREMGRRFGLIEPGEAMIAGLLHDLGTIILVSKFPVQFQHLLELIVAGQPGLEAENTLKLNHEMVGYELACLWKLPLIYRESILFHHRPQRAPEKSRIMATIVAMADILVRKIGFDLKTEDGSLDLGYCLKTLHLSPESLQTFIREMLLGSQKVVPLWQQMIKHGHHKPTPPRTKFSSLMEGRSMGSSLSEKTERP